MHENASLARVGHLEPSLPAYRPVYWEDSVAMSSKLLSPGFNASIGMMDTMPFALFTPVGALNARVCDVALVEKVLDVAMDQPSLPVGNR